METAPTSEATSRLARVVVPVALGILFLGVWEFLVRWLEVPKFVLPAPSLIFDSLLNDYGTLGASMWKTLEVTIAAFFVALVLGVTGAILFTQSRLFEISLFPYAVVLQVTPIVSIAPFILIWVGLDHTERALLILGDHRGVLSDPVQHHARDEERRPQSAQPVRSLSRLALAAAALSAVAERDALPSRWHENFGRTCADRNGRRRVCCRVGNRYRTWPGALSNPRTGSTFPACSRRCSCCRRSASPSSSACPR